MRGRRRISINPRSNPIPHTTYHKSNQYSTRIVEVTLILDSGEKQKPFRFITQSVQYLIGDWLKEDPEPRFDNPDLFLEKINERRQTVGIGLKGTQSLAMRREWKFIQRDLDLVETVYALGQHLSSEGQIVKLKVGKPYFDLSSKFLVPSKIPIDPRTKLYRLRKTRKRQKLPAAIQIEVWEKYEGCCANCGSMEDLQFDHIIPISKGGSNSIENIQVLCQSCNLKKGKRIGGEED